jgi:predicted MPP superfamily phosphohydrolase
VHLNLWVLEIAVLVIVLNALYAGLLISMLHRRPPWPRFISTAAVVWMTAMCALLIIQGFAPASWEPFVRHWLYLPLGVEMMWNLILLPMVVPLFLLAAIALGIFRPARKLKEKPMTPEGVTRRKFIYLVAGGAAPALAVGMGVHGALTRHDLRVRDMRVFIPNLPQELEGFRIAHVSDLHSGIFCGPARLRIIHDAANDLKADLVAVTGDLINRNMSEFPDALAAIQGVGSRYGTFLCEGNHDIIPGRGLVRDACRANNLPFLFFSSATVMVGNRRIILGGVPWMMDELSGPPKPFSDLFPDRQEGDLRILLAHHPGLFDFADCADLVLSGHTHGGQIMLNDSVGLGPLFFKYWSGLYRHGNTTMIVSNGCGDWFPCRVGAPAEVGLLTLTGKRNDAGSGA